MPKICRFLNRAICSPLDAVVRYPMVCLVGFLLMYFAMLIVLSGGCDAPQDGGCPDGRCPMQQEGRD